MIFATSIIKRLVIEKMFLMAEAICFWTYLLGVFYLVVLSTKRQYCNRIERIKSRPVNYLFCNKQNVQSEFHLDLKKNDFFTFLIVYCYTCYLFAFCNLILVLQQSYFQMKMCEMLKIRKNNTPPQKKRKSRG